MVALLLWTGVAQAGEWKGYLGLGAGMALDRYSEWDAKGAAINAYFGVEAPIGISVGVYGEAAETWGQKFEDLKQNSSSRVQLDYRQYGLEVRFRGFRDRMISRGWRCGWRAASRGRRRRTSSASWCARSSRPSAVRCASGWTGGWG